MKKTVSIILVLLMVFALCPQIILNAAASSPISYLEYNTNEKKFDEKTTWFYQEVNQNFHETEWSYNNNNYGRYVINDWVDFHDRIVIKGNVTLILKNKEILTAYAGFQVEEGSSLTICAQTEEADKMGKLVVYAKANNAAIGSNGSKWGIEDDYTGAVAIHGGRISATGGEFAAGIGGGKAVKGGNVTIYGGIVGVQGGTNAAGIGGGDYGWAIAKDHDGADGKDVYIYGGTVTASGGRYGAGIGGGREGSGGNVTIYGGTVIANGSSGAAGIGGGMSGSGADVKFYGGTIGGTCTYGEYQGEKGTAPFIGKGIDGDSAGSVSVGSGLILVDKNTGKELNNSFKAKSWNSFLCGTNVKDFKVIPNPKTSYLSYNTESKKFDSLTCSNYTFVKQDTTSWKDGWYVVNDSGELKNPVTVTGNVNLIIEDDCWLKVNGGIKVEQGNSLTVYAQSDGEKKGVLSVYSLSGQENAGIGGGKGKNGGTVTIHGCDMNISGCQGAAGIGGGNGGNGGNVTVYDGNITAKGGTGAAGIGGGKNGDGGSLTMYAGTVTAYGDAGLSAIGAGAGGSSRGSIAFPTVPEKDLPVDLFNGRFYTKENGQEWIDVITDGIIYAGLMDKNANTDVVHYLEYNEKAGGFENKTVDTYMPVTKNSIGWTNSWYVVNEDITIDGTVYVDGNVNLIIEDNCTLKVTGSINVPQNSSLTIYAQSEGENMGKLKADGQYFGAGIGGAEGQSGGRITIHGCKIEATGGEGGGAGIGSGCFYIEYEFDEDWYDYDIYECGTAGEITIYGGDVSAQGGYEAAGIGGGYGCDGGTVKIYGGKVNAVGGGTSGYCYQDYVDGIGCGWFDISPDNEPYPLDWSYIKSSYPVEGGSFEVLGGTVFINGNQFFKDVSEVALNVPEKEITLKLREERNLNVTGTDDTIIYSSSNEKVATVDENGNVKALRKGCCTVTATVEGTNISEQIKIKVSYTLIDAIIHNLSVVISFLEDIAFKFSV